MTLEAMQRIDEMHKAGWSTGTIFRNLKEQGHKVTEMSIMSYLGIPMQVDKNNKVKPIKQYRVNTSSYTFRTTEELKNKYHTVCEMLNKGQSIEEIAEKFCCTKENVYHIRKRNLTEIKKG